MRIPLSLMGQGHNSDSGLLIAFVASVLGWSRQDFEGLLVSQFSSNAISSGTPYHKNKVEG